MSDELFEIRPIVEGFSDAALAHAGHQLTLETTTTRTRGLRITHDGDVETSGMVDLDVMRTMLWCEDCDTEVEQVQGLARIIEEDDDEH